MKISFGEFLNGTSGPLAVSLDSTSSSVSWFAANNAVHASCGVIDSIAAFAALTATGRKAWSEDAAVMNQDHFQFLAALGNPRVYDALTVDRALAPRKEKPTPAGGAELARMMTGYNEAPKLYRTHAAQIEAEGFLWRERARFGYRLDVPTAQRELAARSPIVADFGRKYADLNRGYDHVVEKFLSRIPGVKVTLDGTSPKFNSPSVDVSGVEPEFLPMLVEYKAANSAHSRVQQLRKVLKEADEESRVHPIIRSNSAATGRMTMQGIALQSWPTDIRGVWIPEVGEAMVGADFHAVELMIAAALTRSPEFTRRAEEGDIYAEFAEAIGVSRKAAKFALIAFLYGETRVGRVARFGSVEAAVAAEESVSRLFPELVLLSARLEAQSRAGEPLATMFGRPLPVPIDKRGKVRHSLACNLVIQATARDALGVAVRRAHAAGVDLWAPVHDEILATCPKGTERATLDLLTEAMTVELPNSDMVLIAVGTVFGNRWSGK